ncbi:alpha-methylacyl-CoA racemase [Halioglobus japonicus]|uniref:Carnitine dehydratase n=1 Tax=Halioglobus japonicus TaxID=930805 RepID=A0AAP8MDG5_9GAMM|nr:CaiB/BaiF CoA-transferase family protein [Halioglobus japonicus]PLW85522.1 carnitine dehydratase [Halioglobus japonicus]GHD16097.1 alpha-methylacyl-CoA racemase [Halioglobus japonicus]
MGPLAGITIIEIAGIGPAPFAAMSLADMGAEVIRVERPGGGLFSDQQTNPKLDVLNRGKRCICVDLKQPEGVATVLRLIEQADGLLEGNRPGVMERLGLGPDVCLQRNPRLVYGRMTGWGQEGPMAKEVGHDLNYVALSGALHGMGRAGEKPAIPLNLVGDFGGGGIFLAYGLVCALLEAKTSGQGQVVDAAMIDGVANLMSSSFAANQVGFWSDERGTNVLDSGAHFYEVYETGDGKYITIGSIEPQFYAALLERLGDEAAGLENQWDMAAWPALKEKLSDIFKRKTRDEWDAFFDGADICYAPVLSMAEVRHHPHHQERGTFIDDGDVWQPTPAPRFSRTPGAISRPPARNGEHSRDILAQFGFSEDDINNSLASGAVVQAE